VCYGRDDAEEITVTDANLILGRLDADHFLGGRMKLDLLRPQSRLHDLARRLGLPMETTAWGVIRVANSNMERAIRTISVERGYDPRQFTLLAFGGAGPLHACELAETLRIPRVLVPPHPGVLSALGMILADVVKDYSRTVMLPALELDGAELERLFGPLFERARADLGEEGVTENMMTLQPALDVRYAGQSFELTIPAQLDGASNGGRGTPTPAEEVLESALAPGLGIIRDFHVAHRQRFSYASEGEPVEVVNVRLKAIGRTAKPRFSRLAPGDADPWPARIGQKQVHYGDARNPGATKAIGTNLYRRDRLTNGNVVGGPSIVFQLDTTTVIPPRWAATVDVWGNLIVEPEP
jgi:N-methylhydantoinase A